MWAERAYSARAGNHAAELAMHFERGDDHARAGRYHERAAENAQRRYAYREAADHLANALAALGAEGGNATAADRELQLQMALAGALGAARGFSDPAVVAAYSRTWELARRPDQQAAAFPALCGFFRCHVARADLRTAREVGERLVAVARSASDASLLVQALVQLGMALYLQGELTLAEQHIEEGLAFYDRERDRSLAAVYGLDPAVVGLGSGASIAWFLGYPARARERTRKQLSLARELAQPRMLAYALYGAAATSVLYRDAVVTRQHSDELIALSAKEGFPHWAARGKIYRGWAQVATGQGPGGIAEMREGIAAQGPGPEIWQSYFHGLLADALGMLGQPREALAALDDAFAAMERSQQRVVDAELYRMRGELELLASREQSPAVTEAGRLEADRWFQKAIEVARRCQARSFELRAAMSLARLWAGQGRRAQARRVLGDAYASFTEGFESADLREAKALLVELALSVRRTTTIRSKSGGQRRD